MDKKDVFSLTKAETNLTWCRELDGKFEVGHFEQISSTESQRDGEKRRKGFSVRMGVYKNGSMYFDVFSLLLIPQDLWDGK